MLKKKLSPLMFLPVTALFIVGFVVVDDRLATKVNETPKHVWTREECMKCHPGAAGLALMRSKRDDDTFCTKNQARALIAESKDYSKSWK